MEAGRPGDLRNCVIKVRRHLDPAAMEVSGTATASSTHKATLSGAFVAPNFRHLFISIVRPLMLKRWRAERR